MVEQKITLRVDGMTCGHCTGKVEKFVGKLAGVTQVKANLSEKTVEIEGSFSIQEVKDTITRLGYQVID
jgi:copper ion binding protein